MTRRVLVSNRLPELRSGNAELDRWVSQALQPWITQAFEQISFLTPETDAFTPTIRGSGTAGTYELLTNYSRYYRSGDLVHAFVFVQLAAAITAGGTNDLNIAGLPYTMLDSQAPYGIAAFSGVNWAAGANLACTFTGSGGESSTLMVVETNDNAALSLVQVGGLAVNDIIVASIAYITNGVRAA